MNDTLKQMIRTGFVFEIRRESQPNAVFYDTTVGHLREYDRRWRFGLKINREPGYLSLVVQRGTDIVTFAPLPTAVGDDEANKKLVEPDDDLRLTYIEARSN